MKPFIPETLTMTEGKAIRDKLLALVETSVKPVQIDRRDPWPITPFSYIKGELIFWIFIIKSV